MNLISHYIVIVRGIATYLGAAMKSLNNISIDSLELSAHPYSCGTRRVQRAILDNYLLRMQVAQVERTSNAPVILEQVLKIVNDTKTDGLNVIRHLSNYLKLTLTPTLSSTQEIALAVHYVPNVSLLPHVLSRDDLVLDLVRYTIGDCNYNLRDIKIMEQKIDSCKKKLNFTGDWTSSAMEITMAAHRVNLIIAYEIFERIKCLTNFCRHGAQQDLAYVYTLQIAFYKDILDFLINKIGRNPLTDFYVAVEKEYNSNMQKLLNLPDVDSLAANNPVHCAMFFSKYLKMPNQTQWQINHEPKRNSRVVPI